jgi:hypothetical protein
LQGKNTLAYFPGTSETNCMNLKPELVRWLRPTDRGPRAPDRRSRNRSRRRRRRRRSSRRRRSGVDVVKLFFLVTDEEPK